MTSCLLSCTSNLSDKGPAIGGKDLLPREVFALKGSKFVSFRIDSFTEGEKKQKTFMTMHSLWWGQNTKGRKLKDRAAKTKTFYILI